MKNRLTAFFCVIALSLSCLVGCANVEEEMEEDLAIVTDSGKLIVGISEFEPLSYTDEDGVVSGFNVELAKEFASSLELEAEFVQVKKDEYITQLNSGVVDCIWDNNCVINDQTRSSMSCTKPYCMNTQAVVAKSELSSQILSEGNLQDRRVAIIRGSSGEYYAVERGLDIMSYGDRRGALNAVAEGDAEIAIVDSVGLYSLLGAEYADMSVSFETMDEEFGVGFRENSDLSKLLMEFLKEKYADGTIDSLANEYGISENIKAIK